MISELIGNTIQYGFEETSLNSNNELYKSDVIALYFSGKYCKYCNDFSPVLKKVYNLIKEDFNESEFKFDVVFISSDKSEEIFDEHYSTHPWYALPYQFRELKEHLVKFFGFKTIPQLILVNKHGQIIEMNGRRFIMDHQDNVKNIKNLLIGET